MDVSSKIRTNPAISAIDFGIPQELAERAENYARWAVAVEREACAEECENQKVGFRSYFEIDERIQMCADAIRNRSKQ